MGTRDKAARKNAEKELKIINQEHEAKCKEEWELTTGINCMGLRNPESLSGDLLRRALKAEDLG